MLILFTLDLIASSCCMLLYVLLESYTMFKCYSLLINLWIFFRSDICDIPDNIKFCKSLLTLDLSGNPVSK